MNEKNNGFREVFIDCYNYMRDFADGNGDADYWQNAALTANDICSHYKNTNVYKLASDILSAVYSQLQRTIPNGRL